MARTLYNPTADREKAERGVTLPVYASVTDSSQHASAGELPFRPSDATRRARPQNSRWGFVALAGIQARGTRNTHWLFSSSRLPCAEKARSLGVAHPLLARVRWATLLPGPSPR